MLSTATIMKKLLEIWIDLRISTAFLTRIPIRPVSTDKDTSLAKAMRTFPLVGGGIGAVMGLVLFLASGLGLHPLACALLALGVGTLLTGALHEDGLADVADGFGGGKTRADKLKIMRDSRIGVYGVLAVIFSIGLRASALVGMFSPGTAAFALVASGAISRAVLPVFMTLMGPARKNGLGANAGRPENESVITAILLGIAMAFIFPFPAASTVALITAIMAVAAIAWLARSQIGGYSGDVLGACQQVTEVTVLLALAAVAE